MHRTAPHGKALQAGVSLPAAFQRLATSRFPMPFGANSRMASRSAIDRCIRTIVHRQPVTSLAPIVENGVTVLPKLHALTITSLICASLYLIGASGPARAANLKPFTLVATDISPMQDPGVIVGFNPQPEPPGIPATVLDLHRPAHPVLFNPSTGGAFTLLFAFETFVTGGITLPPAPNSDGFTGFSRTIDGHQVNVIFDFGPGVVSQASWASFNPQPEPPGDVLGVVFQFQGAQDPYVGFSVRLDGRQLTFASVPEPASWGYFILGLGCTGAALRWRGGRCLKPA